MDIAVGTGRRQLSFAAVSALLVAALAACSATRAEQPAHPVKYPKPLHGTWMPKEMGCIQSESGGMYEGEALVAIDPDILGQYENTSKPLRVEKVSHTPATWHILSTFSPGTGEYDGEETIIFVLENGTLLMKVGDTTTAYVKCEYKD